MAYAVTYLIGTAFIVWFLPNIGPKLMGVNLKEEGRKLQAKISSAEEAEAGVQSAFQHFGVRAYRVTNPKLLNKTVAELEAMPKEARVFISRVRHDGSDRRARARTVIHPGDVVAVTTRTELLMARGTEIGPEVDDKALLDFPQEFLDVVITNKALAGKTLRELAAMEFSPRGLPAEAPAGRGADALHHRDPYRSGRRVEPGRRQARCRTGGEGAGVRGPAGDHHRHDLRGPGHLFRGTGRAAHGHDRRTPDHPHGQRRRPGHGPGVRVAPVRAADLRPDPRAGHVGLRHRRT